MQNKMMLIIGALIVLGCIGLVYWGIQDGKQSAAPQETADVVYYFGEECPHCKAINEFLEANNISSKVDFVKKEVWHNQANSREMQKRADACGIDKNAIGVPFVYAASENKCYVGEPDVRKFFSDKAGLSPAP